MTLRFNAPVAVLDGKTGKVLRVCPDTANGGKLIWKYRTGPARAYISAFGRLVSPWPPNGSPMVIDGRVFCAAGRSMSLDTGIYSYKLDAKTGELLQQANLQTDTEPKRENADNILAAMLVSNGHVLTVFFHLYWQALDTLASR